MAQKPKIRAYRGSDGKHIQSADSLKNSAVRDQPELEDFGVTPTTITVLMAARNAFANSPTDEELSGFMIIATQAKNASRADIQKQIRLIADRARIKYGEEDGRFRVFGVEMLTRQNDEDLLRCAYRVVRMGTQFLAELASEGLVVGMLTALEAAADTFDNQIDAQIEAIKNRDIAVDTRIGLGNDLYTLMVNLAAKGKLCWGDVNEAKYNDYILTHSSSGNHATEGIIGGTSVVSTSVTGIDATTLLTLKNTGNAPLRFYCAENPTDAEGAIFVEVAPNQSVDHIAAELGYSEQLSRINVHNLTPTASSYRVEWGD